MRNESEKQALKQYISEIKRYPLLSKAETHGLLVRYQKFQDKAALDKLTTHNLRLSLKVALRFEERCKTMTLLDLIQESNLLMIKAIKLFDMNRGVKLSTYICSSIERSLQRSIENQDETIRLPNALEVAARKYNNYVNEYIAQHKAKPSQEEIQSATGLSLSTISTIEEIYKFRTSSLNTKIKDDKNQTEIMSMVPYKKNDYHKIEIAQDNIILLQSLRDFLNPREYYIIYNRFVIDSPKTLEELGLELEITRERVRQIEHSTLVKLKPILKNIQIITNKKYKNMKIDQSMLIPLSPKEKLMLFYLKNNLDNLKYHILYTKVCNPQNDNFSYYQKKMPSISNENLKEILTEVENIIRTAFTEEKVNNLYDLYKEKYTISQLFELDILPIKNNINYQEILEFCNNTSLGEIENSEYYQSLNQKSQQLIAKFYQENYRRAGKHPYYYRERIERNLNLLMTGNLSKKQITLSQTEIKKILDENQHLLTDKDNNYIRYHFLNQKEVECNDYYDKKYWNYYQQKLFLLKFGIAHFFEQQITLDQINKVKKKSPTLLSEDEQYLVDNYYGNGVPKKTYQELANELGKEYQEIHDIIRKLRRKVITNYFNLNQGIKDIPTDKIKKYISDPRYEFSKENRDIMNYYLAGSSYQEIALKTSLSQIRVANSIAETIRKSNFYNYGIKKVLIITEQELEDLYNKNQYNNLEKTIINEYFIQNKQQKEIAQELEITTNKVKTLIQDFYDKYLKSKINNIPEKQYTKELTCHVTDTILTAEERYFLSLVTSHSLEEVKKQLKYSPKKMKKVQEDIDRKIRERILNIKAPSYGIISREEALKALNDPNIPLTDREKEILSHIKELNNYVLLSEKELATKYQMSASSLKRRYERIILSILQYNNSKKILLSYEKEIEPNLKYFCNIDRKIIELAYRDKLSYNEIAQKLNVSLYIINQTMHNIKIGLAAILTNHPTARKFDFDYARKVLEEPDIPIYGNKNLKIEIYKLFFGENSLKKYSVNEIKKMLNLTYQERAITTAAYNVMIAVEKYKLGERKQSIITEEDVIKYYQQYHSSMGNHKRKIYNSYFRRASHLNNNQPIPEKINFDILEDKNQIVFRLDENTKEDIKRLILSKKLKISSQIGKLLKEYYGITEREVMNGKEKERVLKLLEPLYLEKTNSIAGNEKNCIKKKIKPIYP